MNSLIEENRTEEPLDKGLEWTEGSHKPPHREGRAESRVAIAALVLSALALIAACASLYLQLRVARDSASDEDGVEMKGDKAEQSYIQFRDHILPIMEDVPVNEYAAEAFVLDGAGHLRYGDAPLGIDVSSYQGEIDWEQVAGSGVSFAMIRAGLRGYTKGGIMQDAMFERNIKGALAAGLKVGVYFFSQAISVQEAEEEADYLLKLIEGYDVAYPVVFDWENVGDTSARTNGVSSEQVTRCARVFCDRIAEAGFQPMVYFNSDQGYLSYQLDKLGGYLFWLAEYRDHPGFYYHFDFWQYTHKGNVAGIDGAVDLDLDLRGS